MTAFSMPNAPLPNMRPSGRVVNELPMVAQRRAAQLWR